MFEERVLILTPTGADAEVASGVLAEAGIASMACSSLAELCDGLDQGAGALLIAEEALFPRGCSELVDCLAAQPPWSDVPLIVLTTADAGGQRSHELTERFGLVGNITLLERPFRVATLVSAVRAALRARRKQYDHKRYEAEREGLLISERAARAAAENASRMKDEFLATLSHELRTPLNAIVGWSQILQSSHAPQDLKEGLEVIARNARAQQQIIDDLLDMSRIISGKVRLDVQRIDLRAVIVAAIDTVRHAAEAKGIRLQPVLDPRAGPVSGDQNRLQQVFWNLLTNAIKFTPRNGRVQVVLERVNSHLEIAVIDTGEGIKPEFLPHVFDRFRQADASTTRRHGGLGIGLAIVKQLVELHGGTIRVTSQGQATGTAFTVTLPLTVLHSEPEPKQERRHPTVRPDFGVPAEMCLKLRGVKVLVVDDEPDARTLVRRLLEDCEAVVATASSAAEAFESLLRHQPDVLVSDIGMPGEDGYSLIRRVRKLDAATGGQTPALALTAYARSEDRTNAILAGFQMHASKPVQPSELIAMVASLAGRAETPVAAEK